MAHIRQSRPDSGLGFQVKVLSAFQLFFLCSEVEGQGDYDDGRAGYKDMSRSKVDGCVPQI